MAWLAKPKEGTRYRFRHWEFYAVEGMVAFENLDTGAFKCMTWQDALKSRAKAFNSEVSHMHYADEKTELSRCVFNLIEAAEEAKAQGDPTDTEVARQKAREQRTISASFGDSSPARIRRPVSEPKYFLPDGRSVAVPDDFLIRSDRFKSLSLD